MVTCASEKAQIKLVHLCIIHIDRYLSHCIFYSEEVWKLVMNTSYHSAYFFYPYNFLWQMLYILCSEIHKAF